MSIRIPYSRSQYRLAPDQWSSYRIFCVVGAWEIHCRWVRRTRTANVQLVARHVELSTTDGARHVKGLSMRQ